MMRMVRRRRSERETRRGAGEEEKEVWNKEGI
jgi:hypothetical protein